MGGLRRALAVPCAAAAFGALRHLEYAVQTKGPPWLHEESPNLLRAMRTSGHSEHALCLRRMILDRSLNLGGTLVLAAIPEKGPAAERCIS
jgi:hypothetical protein